MIVLATAPNGDTEAIEVERWLLERNAQKDPRFVFVNARDDAFRDTCLLAADAALLTSLYEPCGLTDIEAYWFGVPCVVHEVGGLAKGVRDPEMYTQIARNYPPDAPVAAAYSFCDNTNPGAEAELLVQKCNDLLSWDERQRKNLQLKALTLLEFSYEIPANRYIDLIQYVWLSQLWRWLKDQRRAASSDILAEQAAKWIAADRGSFRAGKGHGCCSSLRDLYAWAFVPPTEPIGIPELDEDIRLDCQLRQRLDELV